ncbi:hypothetical protein [Micrococcus endophyticus]|uniref:hypothetical protein n=1 Tax=Micrococcus endophyticus TaxID=455343 RepID=UPI0034CF8DCA
MHAQPRSSAPATRRALRLPAALLGAGLLAGGLAGPAHAAPEWDTGHGVPGGYFQVDDATDATMGRFQTFHGYDPVDLSVYAEALDDDGASLGARMAVPFAAIGEVDGGRVDLLQARRDLGEEGAGRVRFGVTAHGQDLDFALTLAPDADLSDSSGAPVEDVDDAFAWHLSDAPLMWSSDVVMAPGVAALDVAHDVEESLLGHALPSIQAQPAHGELHVLRDRDRAQLRAVYVPDEGFTGTDTFTVDFHGDKVAHVQTVTVHVGRALHADLGAFDVDGDGVVNGRAMDPADPEDAALLAALRGDDASPAPAEPSPRPSTPAPAPSAGEPASPTAPEEHEVPERVETGNGAAWLLASAAALGAGALVAARRRFALAR